MRKTIYIALAVMLAIMISVPAMAFKVTTRSAEMIEHSACDQAGSVTMKFEEADIVLLNNYLLTHDYAEIRVFLNAEEWPGGTPMPNLCKDIKGIAVAAGVPHTGELVLLDQFAEMSSFYAPADAEVYVWGDDGDDVVYVYITTVIDAGVVVWPDEGQWPWFKFGLHDTVDGVDVSTAICAQVLNFENPTTLTISNEAFPHDLTFTGDNEIGHFKPSQFTATDCVKGDYSGSIATEVQLCEESAQAECMIYEYCFIVEGDFGTDSTIDVTMRTNGADCNYDTQQGVYLEGIKYYKNGVLIGVDAGTNVYDFEEDDCVTPAVLNCAWEAEHALHRLNNTFSDTDELMIVVAYSVNYLEAVVGTKVRFWFEVAGVPCTAFINGMMEAADLVPCGGGSIYFPYVIGNSTSWVTGIVVTNLGSPLSAVDKAAMEATFTLTDYTGAAFVYTKTNFTNGIWVNTVDGLIAEAGWVPASGAAWLLVETNFDVDGYSFLTDGTFGAGTLPRLSCR